MLRSRLTALAVLAVAGFGAPRAVPAATTCTTNCAQTTCTVGCAEVDVRDAIKKANDCTGDPAWTGRTITVAGAPCTIAMLNDAASAALFPNSSCASDPERHAVCLTNNNIRFDGAGAVFSYAGTALCGQCASGCAPPQPGLFTLKGNGNTIQNLTYRYFPEGIHIRAGNGHTIAAVRADRICEDAITVDTSAGTGHVIRGSTLLGNQAADPGRACVLANGSNGACGTDKAIQLNGGSARIEDNTIDLISTPVTAAGGSHEVVGNRSHGSTLDQNVCQAYAAAGSSTLRFRGNTLDHCKFGVRADEGALVIAEDNTITNPWVSAFSIRGTARVKGTGNRIRTRPAGFTQVSDCQRGLLVVRSDARARVDFGGGDFEGRSVVDGVACASGGECSAGGNRFCSLGAGVQTDIWNITDCPCLNHFCNGTLGSCTVGACAPIDASGGCAGTNGQGASVGVRANCFAPSGGDPPGGIDLKDSGAATTATAGAILCSPAECGF